MKSILITLLVIIVGFFLWIQPTYNELVESDEQVHASWSQVENLYQRRADLIPNLVNTVKGYAKHENKTLTEVIEARAKATHITIDADNLDEASMRRYQNVQGELGNTLGRLLALTENYPELKADAHFMNLQEQLKETEQGITDAREIYNETVHEHNVLVRSFPENVFASMCGFSSKPYFESHDGADRAPVVNFDD